MLQACSEYDAAVPWSDAASKYAPAVPWFDAARLPNKTSPITTAEYDTARIFASTSAISAPNQADNSVALTTELVNKPVIRQPGNGFRNNWPFLGFSRSLRMRLLPIARAS
jgi:hypothetical protein